MASIAGVGPATAATEYPQMTDNKKVAKTYPDKKIRDLIPTTQLQLDQLTQDQQFLIESTTKELHKQFEDKRPMSGIILLWDQVASSTQVFGSTMYVTQGQKIFTKEAIGRAQEAVATTYNERLQDEGFRSAFVSYAEDQLTSANSLTPYERHYLYSIALGYGENDLAESIKGQGIMEDFKTFESKAPIKTLPEDGSFGTLSGNIIFMPGNYTYYFGGIQPWTERIDGVADKILESGKPFLALQEVFDEKAAEALVDKLKGEYRYFYYNQGANYFGLNNPDDEGIKAENLGINSGLFIASQYKIASHTFTPYKVEGMQWQVKKGFDVTELESDGKVFARIITTHLQPFNSDEDRAIRVQEMQAIVDYIKDNPIDAPTFVEGDLNILFGEHYFDGKLVKEYGDSSIPTHFIDLGNEHVTAVTPGAHTCTDRYEDGVYGRDPSSDLIYDYALLLIGDKGKVLDPTVTRVSMHNLDDRTEPPLSDHNMLALQTKIVR